VAARLGEVRIRPARRADLPAIISMLADDELRRGREIVSEPLMQAYSKAFEDIAANEPNILVVAEASNGSVLGCLQLTFIPASRHRTRTYRRCPRRQGVLPPVTSMRVMDSRIAILPSLRSG